MSLEQDDYTIQSEQCFYNNHCYDSCDNIGTPHGTSFTLYIKHCS